MKSPMPALLLILTLLLSTSFTTSVAAQNNLLREDIPDRYIVKKGDTLWDISSLFLKSPWLWPEIWHANPQISNPHLIYPGDVISLVYIDGQPRLTVNRTVKLRPNTGLEKLRPQMRELPTEEAIPAIPLEEINAFLSRSRILKPGELATGPYVVAGQEGRILLGVGDKLYARGEFADNIPSYGIYRQGTIYTDPVTEEVLGVQALDIASANMRALEGDVATLSITRSTGDIRLGDRILPIADRNIDPTFFPSPPDNNLDGKIISVEGGVTQVGQLDIVAINLGDRDGYKVGNIMAIYKLGEVISDKLAPTRKERPVKLPDERAGLVMIFQTFEKMSMAVVIEADRGITIGDEVRNP